VYRWILEPSDRDAVLANVAIKSGKNYNVIVEISTVLSPEELFNVRRAYINRYKRSLEEDVAAHTSGHLRQVLVFFILDLTHARILISKISSF
jgi:annexin A7/11